MPARKSDGNDDGFFGVIAITCFPGNPNRWVQTFRVNFLARSSAYEHCDKLQDQLDADGDPARAYVVDEEGLVIRAGRAAYLPPNYFFAKHEPRKIDNGKAHTTARKSRPPDRTSGVARPRMGA